MAKYQLTTSYRNKYAITVGFFAGMLIVFLLYLLALKIRPTLPVMHDSKEAYSLFRQCNATDFVFLFIMWVTASSIGGLITYKVATTVKNVQGAAVSLIIILMEVFNMIGFTVLWVIVTAIIINLLRMWVNTNEKKKRLEEINQELEKEVTLRTAEIIKQKEIVEHQKEDILDSIKYAKRLQDAILPSLSSIRQNLPESFVLYKPKDIVAGDFYWLEKTGDTILVAACDCTGHGVPGALVSVVCSNALNRAVKEFGIKEPGKILDKVRELVIETFEKSDETVKDGMDISLAALRLSGSSMQLQWSGAYNSLWYIQKGEVKEVAADKQPIGKHDKQTPFTQHTIALNKGDVLYLFTDGYADQFGGPKGKKFKYKQLQEKLLEYAHKPMEQQKEQLNNILENWKGTLEQVDDILIIGIRV